MSCACTCVPCWTWAFRGCLVLHISDLRTSLSLFFTLSFMFCIFQLVNSVSINKRNTLGRKGLYVSRIRGKDTENDQGMLQPGRSRARLLRNDMRTRVPFERESNKSVTVFRDNRSKRILCCRCFECFRFDQDILQIPSPCSKLEL